MPNTVSGNLRLNVREGRLGEARILMADMIASTQQETGAIVYEWFLNEDETACQILERYADSNAAVTHLAGFRTNFAERFLACFEPTELVVYGDPTDEARAALDGLGATYLGAWGGFAL